MISNTVNCKVYPYHPDCRGISTLVYEGEKLLVTGNDQVLALLSDDKAQVMSFMTFHVHPELISTLQNFVSSFGIIG